MTITEFLEARIAEDEYSAQLTYATAFVGRIEGSGSRYDLALRMTPARVLAECAAKRAIIGLHLRDDDVQRMVYGDIYPCTECGDVDDSPVEWPCRTLRSLAAVYADHPDYRQEWAL